MKKIILLTVTLLLLVCLVAGCDMVRDSEKALEQGAKQVEEGASSLMNDGKAILNEGKDMIQGDSINKGGSSPTNEQKSKFIGEEKAKELALKKVGVGINDVRFDRVELDHDDGIWQYEVDFRYGDMEYDIDINAETGEIISFEKEKEAGA